MTFARPAARAAILMLGLLLLWPAAGQARQPKPAATAKGTPPAAAPAPADAQPPESAPQPPLEDPLGRESPRGTFVRFIAAAEAGTLDIAAQYLQWPRKGLPITREEAARQLSYVLNHS